jgi:hypothetical protein
MVLKEMGGVVPGSKPSGYFQMEQYLPFIKEQQQQATNTTTTTDVTRNATTATTTTTFFPELWRNYKVLYSHTMLNKYSGGGGGGSLHRPSQLEHFLATALAAATNNNQSGSSSHHHHQRQPRKIRVLTIIRDPLPCAASSVHEWMCHVKRKLGVAKDHHTENMLMMRINDNNNNATRGMNKNNNNDDIDNNDPCVGFTTLESIHTFWMEQVLRPVCLENETRYQKHVNIPEMCPLVRQGHAPMAYCQSIRYAMDSNTFKGVHDQLKHYIPEDVYDHYQKEKLLQLETSSSSSSKTKTKHQRLSDYEFHALRRLGGLTAQASAHMMWHGITERMHESMCLFHFVTDFPYRETPHSRHKQCRPLRFWNESDKAVFREREELGYAVSRAAHAILDVRMANMCRTLRLYDYENANDGEKNNTGTKNNSSTLHTASSSNRGYRHLSLPESCCANFVFDDNGRLIGHVPSEIY